MTGFLLSKLSCKTQIVHSILPCTYKYSKWNNPCNIINVQLLAIIVASWLSVKGLVTGSDVVINAGWK